MVKYKILLKPEWRKQKFPVLSIFFMMFVLSLFLFLSVTLLNSGRFSVEKEMERLNFGDFTAWVINYPEELPGTISRIPDTAEVMVQDIIFAGYEANGKYSDNEGQLMFYNKQFPYNFINEDGKRIKGSMPEPGTIYVSPAMQQIYGIKAGDSITFELSRTNGKKTFIIAGFFEDAFMGSSMIDMKSFIVNNGDYQEMCHEIQEAGKNNALAGSGAMLHISKAHGSQLTDTEFYQKLIEETELSRYTEFTYRKNSIMDYMLLLQNILAGFLAAFSILLFLVCTVITGHSLETVIGQEKNNMAALKMAGLPGGVIQQVYIFLYGGSGVSGVAAGLFLSIFIPGKIAKAMVSSTGMLIDIKFPVKENILIFVLLLMFNIWLVCVKTGRILAIRPIQVTGGTEARKHTRTHIGRKHLPLNIAVREVMANKKKYIALFLVAALLTFFTGIINNINSWTGRNGEGLMDAFSVAAHDLGVQPFNSGVPMDEIERVINWYSPVIDKYELAMQSVAVNGHEYTANILNRTELFHIIKGEEPEGNEILITNTVADGLGINIGSIVKVSAMGRVEEYRVSGIYQCANGMGANIGMTVPGYSQIGDVTGFIWCYHYILKDGDMRDYAYKYLEENYKEIDVHTNSWQGLGGIVKVIHTVVLAVYIIAFCIILLVTALIASKILLSEIPDLAIYRSLGFTGKQLVMLFALRFFIVAAAGAGTGSILQALSGRKILSNIFRMFGIGEFKTEPDLAVYLIPFTIIPLMFLFFALIYSGKAKNASIISLIEQNE